MKILVIYQSKYGSTKQYADWIAEDVVAETKHVDDMASVTISNYDWVIFGSYVRAGKIVDIDFIIKNWSVLKDKRVVLFTVSAAPAGSAVLVKAIEKGLPQSVRQKITIFSFQGRMTKIDARDRVFLFLGKYHFYLKMILKGKFPKFNPYAPFDKVDRGKISQLVSLVNGVNQ